MPKSYDYFSEIIEEMGIPLEEARLIRHASANKEFRESVEKGYYIEHTATQVAGRFKDVNYLFTFIGDSKKTVFHSAYEVVTSYPYSKASLPADFPGKPPEEDIDNHIYMELREIPLPGNIQSLTVEWGKGFRSYIQRASKQKEILEITYNEDTGK